MTPLYYRGAHVVLLVFAVNDRGSFNEVDEWNRGVREALGDTAALIVVGNKCDLPRAVTFEDAQKKATSLNGSYIETCTITGAGINQLFNKVAEIILTQRQSPRRESDPAARDPLRSRRCC
jgi:GTPase SAR1 family protein